MILICRYFLCFFALLFLTSCGEEQSETQAEIAKPVKTVTITDKQFVESRIFPGKVEAGKEAKLSFQISGKLVELNVKQGQTVNQGDIVAKIDPTDFQLKVNEAKANRDEAKVAFERAAALVKKDIVSKAEYDKKKATYDIAEANLKLAEQNLNYTILYAPYSGVIADTYPDAFEFLNAKEPIVLLQDLSELDITIDVPENIVIGIREKEVISRSVEFDAAPGKTFEITYKKHELQADDATQTYRVYFTMPRPETLEVLPGMTASVKVKFRDKNQAIAQYKIPSSAVFADEEGKKFIWIIDPQTKRLKSAEVFVGDLLDQSIIIQSGLNVGDQVVIAGVHLLQENQLVKALETEFGRE